MVRRRLFQTCRVLADDCLSRQVRGNPCPAHRELPPGAQAEPKTKLTAMNEADRILVVIPVYNCAAQISRVLAQFSEPSVAAFFSEILVIDNGSRDNTREAAIGKAKELALGRITVARNKGNYGLGGSHKSAFLYASSGAFSHIVVLHGDDQGHIRDLVPVLKSGDHRRFDCCLGSRLDRLSCLRGYSRIRVAGDRIFNLLFSTRCASVGF